MSGIVSILKIAIDIYASLLLIRVLLQLVQADFFNPISQTLFKVTSPVVEPLRGIFPTIGNLNTAGLAAALLLKWVYWLIVLTLSGLIGPQMLGYLAVALVELLGTLIDIYFWGIFILVISSWVGTASHPTVRLVTQIVDPYMAPFRRIIPNIGMIDLSPMVAIFTLMIVRDRLMPQLVGVIQPLLG
ncbi:MAG: YggT family protein [Parasphingorhabdus sp.]|jgi:YggT family protein|tara:strand:+ start:660 stop:1220 length:561 start_codon:yes stop_codon:yes gene_type:complete